MQATVSKYPVDAVDSDDPSIGAEVSEDSKNPPIVLVVKGGNHDQVVGDVKV